MKARQTFGASDRGARRHERQLLKVRGGDGAVAAAQLGRNAAERFPDRFSRAAARCGQRVGGFDVGKVDQFRDRVRRDIAFDASAVAVLAGANALSNLRRQTLQPVAETHFPRFQVERVVAVIRPAGVKAVDLVPFDPALALFDFEPEAAGDDGLVDQPVALIGLRIAGAQKFRARFFGLRDFGGVCADEDRPCRYCCRRGGTR